MTPTQQFILALTTILTPLFSTALVIVSAVVVFLINRATSAAKRQQDLADRQAVITAAKEATDAAKNAAVNAEKSALAATETARASASQVSQVHQAVLDVGSKADASFNEANHANEKMQAVLDAVNTFLGLPNIAVTANTLDPVAYAAAQAAAAAPVTKPGAN